VDLREDRRRKTEEAGRPEWEVGRRGRSWKTGDWGWK